MSERLPSFSFEAQTEDIYVLPDLEYWTLLISKGDRTKISGRFGYVYWCKIRPVRHWFFSVFLFILGLL